MLQAVADSGARWFEMDIDWNSIQAGGPTSFWWDATDRVVLDARARGLKILGGLGYTPGWARPANCPPNTDKCLPASPEYFADFARAAAQRYGSASTIPSLRGSIHDLADLERAEPLPVRPAGRRRPGVHPRCCKRAYVEIKKVDPRPPSSPAAPRPLRTTRRAVTCRR